jgi:hypothetical protein
MRPLNGTKDRFKAFELRRCHGIELFFSDRSSLYEELNGKKKKTKNITKREIMSEAVMFCRVRMIEIGGRVEARS